MVFRYCFGSLRGGVAGEVRKEWNKATPLSLLASDYPEETKKSLKSIKSLVINLESVKITS